MAGLYERVASGVLTLSAVAIAAAVVHRQFLASPAAASGGAPTVSFLDTWRELGAAGRQVGDPNAPIQIIEFIDLECPGCAAFQRTLGRLAAAGRWSFGVTYVHFPIQGHPHAREAARAAECGAVEGRFGEMVEAILARRDSLASADWAGIATAAGVRDRRAFERCVADTGGLSMVEAGVAAGERISVRATPTILVNGWRFSAPPVANELEHAFSAIQNGEALPFSLTRTGGR